MESVINKLAEIETAATKIMQAAENQKKLQDEQQEERIAKFDADLEAETAKRIEEITTKLHSTTDADQKKQRDSAAELLSSLDAYYEQNHGTLSTQIYENIIRKLNDERSIILQRPYHKDKSHAEPSFKRPEFSGNRGTGECTAGSFLPQAA